jgi:copper chaperone CopZ
MSELTFSVPDMTCRHCEHAVSSHISTVPGVLSVVVDLETKRVAVRGEQLDDAAIRDAITDAGYEAA